jgi:phosphohistidine phosphatase
MPETRHLLLLRHAKSSWDDPALADHDRPLAPRGRKAAKLIGAHLSREGIVISRVLCSSALRTRQTLELVEPAGEVQIEDELYGATDEYLLDRVRRESDEHQAVMLIGHNPAMQELTLLLSPGAEDRVGKFPTGALATLTFTGSWASLAPGQADLVAFVKPRELG